MPNEETVERVAKAIFEALDFRAPVEWQPEGNSFKQDEARAYARAALAAMGWRDIASALTTWCHEQSSLHHRLAHEGKDDDELCSQHIALSSAYLTVADKIATLPTPPEQTT